jgi:DNA-binding transcriptional LysR family regulator
MSPNFTGIQAAVSAGFGVSILPEVAILADHRVLGVKDDLLRRVRRSNADDVRRKQFGR